MKYFKQLSYCPLSPPGNGWEQLNVNVHEFPHWIDNRRSEVLHLQGGWTVPKRILRGCLLPLRPWCWFSPELRRENVLSSWVSCLCLSPDDPWLFNYSTCLIKLNSPLFWSLVFPHLQYLCQDVLWRTGGHFASWVHAGEGRSLA